MTEAKLKPGAELAFIHAGKATFTVRSLKTGARYTYRVTRGKERENQPAVYFVKLLTGPDNNTQYTYMGMLRGGQFKLTKASRYTAGALPVVGFSWVYERLTAGRSPSNVEIWHAGHCGRCGRQLTVPESVEAGYGPECIQLMGGDALSTQKINSRSNQFSSPLNEAPVKPGASCSYCGEETPGCRCERKAAYQKLENQQEQLAFMADLLHQEAL